MIGLALTVETDGREIRVERLPAEVGRDPRCAIRVDCAAVSAVHLTIMRAGEFFFAMDRHSTNGSAVNGRPLKPGVYARMGDGDRLSVGGAGIRVAVVEGRDEGGTRTRFAHLLGESDLAEPVGPSLVVLNGPAAGTVCPLSRHNATLVAGRSADAGLRIDDWLVSARHFEIVPRGRGFAVRDTGSRNGTRVNGQRLPGVRTLQDHDEIVVGGTCVQFCDAGDRVPPAVSPAGGPDTGKRSAGSVILVSSCAILGLGSLGLAALLFYCLAT